MGETNGDSWRCGQGEGRYVLTPFANNRFIKKDFHVLEKSVGGRACGPSLPSLASENSALGPLSSHRGPYELPQASFSPTGISQARLAHSLWQLQAWQVASQAHLGCLLESWVSDVEEAGVEDFQKERPRRECLRPPEVLEIPGNELRASKKKKKRGKAKTVLCHLASSTSVQRRISARPLPSCIWT